MKRVLSRISKRIMARVRGLSPAVLTGLAIVGVLGLVAGALATYQTYDYVQHDNDFCVSCHLMREPFERFGASVHRDLGCKACHQPTPVERTAMGLRQVVSNPDEITVHAEVPNERCEECHMSGHAEEWVQIADSRGHAIHLESREPVLRGMECVVCHSEDVHLFRTSNETCSQRGCHGEAEVRLGAMADMSMPCEACHAFRAPLVTGSSGEDPASLTPDVEQCLACHQMRQQVDLADFAMEPHQAQCGICHNAHTQREAVEAVASCTETLCHTVPETFENDHHRWPDIRIADCTQCHTAHTFKVDGEDCDACHDEIIGALEPAPEEATPTPGAEAADPFDGPVGGWDGGVLGFYGIGAPPTLALPVAIIPVARAVQSRPFDHDRHRSVECRSCHTTGTSVVRGNAQWCSNCHHRNRSENSCVRCHDAGGQATSAFDIVMNLPGGAQDRQLGFPHGGHQEKQCSDCHGSPPGPVAGDFSCASCHDDHHLSETVDCLQCHSQPARWAHVEPLVHRTCAGGVCHTAFALGPPESWGRAVCVACHEEYAEGELPTLPGQEPTDTAWIPLRSGGDRAGGRGG